MSGVIANVYKYGLVEQRVLHLLLSVGSPYLGTMVGGSYSVSSKMSNPDHSNKTGIRPKQVTTTEVSRFFPGRRNKHKRLLTPRHLMDSWNVARCLLYDSPFVLCEQHTPRS